MYFTYIMHNVYYMSIYIQYIKLTVSLAAWCWAYICGGLGLSTGKSERFILFRHQQQNAVAQHQACQVNSYAWHIKKNFERWPLKIYKYVNKTKLWYNPKGYIICQLLCKSHSIDSSVHALFVIRAHCRWHKISKTWQPSVFQKSCWILAALRPWHTSFILYTKWTLQTSTFLPSRMCYVASFQQEKNEFYR